MITSEGSLSRQYTCAGSYEHGGEAGVGESVHSPPTIAAGSVYSSELLPAPVPLEVPPVPPVPAPAAAPTPVVVPLLPP